MTINTLYFSVVNVGGLEFSNGGNLCCRNHIRRLAEDEGIKLHVVIAGIASDRKGICDFLEELGVPYAFLEIVSPASEGTKSWVRKQKDWLLEQSSYLFERSANQNPQIEARLVEAIEHWNISNLVVDYLPSTLFCRKVFQEYPSVLITLNREGEFYKDLRDRGIIKKKPLAGWISQKRWDNYEKWAYRKASKVIAIGKPDLPKISGLRSAPQCITPYLPPNPKGWSYVGSNTAFFVGNIHHYPNRLAMEWICTKMVPVLSRESFPGRIVVVGASKDEVPQNWHSELVEFAGFSTAEHVQQLFREADVCLCPVENDYGMKFKAAEAVAYGTPLLASRQTLLGFPYLQDQPALDLSDSQAAAELLTELFRTPEKIIEMQKRQQNLHDEFVATQKNVWSRHVIAA